MYIKFIDNTILECTKDPIIKNNTLYLYFGEQYTAENLYTLFSVKENLVKINTYSTDKEDSYYGSYYNFTVLGSSSIIDGEKVITLFSEVDADSVRITTALSNSIEANSTSQTANQNSQNATQTAQAAAQANTELLAKLEQTNANIE